MRGVMVIMELRGPEEGQAECYGISPEASQIL